MPPKDNLEKIYYPILVPDQDETKEKMLNRWDVFDTLSEDIQYKLSDKKIAQEIRSISTMFSLNSDQVASVSKSIRRYFFKEISLEGILTAISRETGLPFDTCEKIYDLLREKVINIGAQKESAKMLSMTISKALETYPTIGEQMITSMPLNMKSFPRPVRPSISNWISDYHFNVGFNNKDAMVRGNYLFHSKSTESLSDIERDRLSQIFKSLDENTPVLIDETKKAVVFAKFQEKKPPVPLQSSPKTNKETADENTILSQRLSAWRTNDNRQDPYENKISFSSPHRLPIEKNIPKIQNNSIFSKQPAEQPKSIPFTPIDLSNLKEKSPEENIQNQTMKNVVNLKEK